DHVAADDELQVRRRHPEVPRHGWKREVQREEVDDDEELRERDGHEHSPQLCFARRAIDGDRRVQSGLPRIPGAPRLLKHGRYARWPVDVELRPIQGADELALFDLFARIVADKEGFPQAPPLTRDVFEETWIHHATTVVVARAGDDLAGAYYLK